MITAEQLSRVCDAVYKKSVGKFTGLQSLAWLQDFGCEGIVRLRHLRNSSAVPTRYAAKFPDGWRLATEYTQANNGIRDVQSALYLREVHEKPEGFGEIEL